jgi:murein DD-endopeptidase MepM/ murein hydrolase activator NlpD
MVALLAISLSLAAPVARPFTYGADPFRAGWHRGADFVVAPGARVGATCSGRVVWAGRDVVTLRCGSYRVTHLPLARVTARRGARVRAGARIGTLGRSRDHVGLHVGVRRAGDRFGYVDPVPLLAEPPPHGVPVAPRPARPRGGRPAARPRAPAPLRVARPGSPPQPVRAGPPPAAVRVPAPWPAWLGLAVLLAGAVGGGMRITLRRRRATATVLARR